MNLTSFTTTSMLLAVYFNKNCSLNDELITKLAVALRKEYPQRQYKDEVYMAYDNKEKRAFILTESLINIREDQVKDYKKNIDMIVNTSQQLKEFINLEGEKAKIKIEGEFIVSSEDDYKQLSLKTLFPKGVNISSIPGSLISSSASFDFQVGEEKFNVKIMPTSTKVDKFKVECNILTSINGVKVLNSLLIDNKSLLEGMIKEIVADW